jgi:hypothetical protein
VQGATAPREDARTGSTDDSRRPLLGRPHPPRAVEACARPGRLAEAESRARVHGWDESELSHQPRPGLTRETREPATPTRESQARDALLLLYAAGGATATGGIGGETGWAASSGPQLGWDFAAPSEVTCTAEAGPGAIVERLCAQISVAPLRSLT